MKNRLIVIAFGMAWLVAVTYGLRVMLAYEDTPGKVQPSPVQWPAESRIKPATDRATLIMTAHPQCPCTRASIGELNALMARVQDKVAVTVLFVKPKGFAAGWEKTDLWRSAAAIPGVKVMVDEEGRESRRFHASVSGQTMLFDRAGRLIFSGGITPGRGHSGDNAGRSAIVSLLTTGKAKNSKTFAFGCALGTPSS